MSNNTVNKQKTLYLVQLAMLTAITIILNFTPLGFLRLGPVEISFMAIPVIVGGVVLGPLAGGILGLVFGICSLSLAPTHPLFGVVFAVNPVLIALVCIVPRVLIGIVAGYVSKLGRNKYKKFSYFWAALLGSLTNTVLFLAGVMLFMEKLLTPKMTELGVLSAKTFMSFWVGIGIANGVPEAAAAVLITVPVVIALNKVNNKK